MHPTPPDTSTLETRPLALAIAACIAFAVVGSLLAGPAGEMPADWYAGLEQPSFAVPVWLFLAMGVVYYFLLGTTLYRVQAHVAEVAVRRRALCLALAVMAINEVWNAVLFRLESLTAGAVGMVAFTGLLLWLWKILWEHERTAFWVLAPFAIWTLYDLAWSVELWRLN
jgi:translocator protein